MAADSAGAVALTAPAEVRRRLQANLDRRGYLLPHQGLMAVAMPEVQDGYMVMYSALTLRQNHLTPFEKEAVWLGILAAAGEHIGTHHVKLFRDFGGTPRQAEAVFRLVGHAAGAEKSFRFLAEHWQRHFAPLDGRRAYLDAGRDLVAGLDFPLPLARLVLLAVHTTLAQSWGIECELEAGYGLEIPEGKMGEACCLPMWATGINRTIDASQVWLELMRSGRVTPSDSFRAWADMDQGAMPL